MRNFREIKKAKILQKIMRKNIAKIFSQNMEIMHIKRKFREKCRIFKTNCKMLAKKLRKFIKKSLKFEDTRLTFKAQLMD